MAESRCPECGHGLVPDTRPLTLEYGGYSEVVSLPGQYCNNCGEGVVNLRKVAPITDPALNRMKAKAHGLLRPEQVRGIRKRLKLTQKDAGTIIGGGPKAFQKYESGRVLVSRAIASALLLLDNDPGLLDVLKSHREGRADPPGEALVAE